MILLVVIVFLSIVYANSVTEETQADFDDGLFTNTTSDMHGNGSVRLQEDAVLIMNFDVNGSISNKITDISNNGNDGTLNNNPFWNQTIGKYNGAYKFNGVNNYIQVTSASTLNITNSITLSSWINGSIFGNGTIIAKKAAVGGYPYLLGFNNVGNLAFNITNSTQTTYIDFPSPSTNIWHHIVGTYNGTNISLYIDGVLVNSTIINGSINKTVDDLFIGAINITTVENPFNGTIDDVRIYIRCLSAEEILTINNSLFRKTGIY